VCDTQVCDIGQTAYSANGISSSEALMSSDENYSELRASVATNAPDDQPSASIPGDGLAPELNSISSKAFPTPVRNTTRPSRLHIAKNVKLEDLFVTQLWHRPYAEALLETDPCNLPALVASAERAILDRYLELGPASGPSDELVDLAHAVEALSQIKKVRCIAV
jgi:hypothetical protein